MVVLLVIVNDLHISRSWRPVRPLEAYPPLVVDADTILAFPIPNERFEAVSGQRRQVCQRYSRLKAVELQARRAFDSREGPYALTGGKISGMLIPIAGDYYSTYMSLCVTSSITNGTSRLANAADPQLRPTANVRCPRPSLEARQICHRAKPNLPSPTPRLLHVK